jgi:hypothetical protein
MALRLLSPVLASTQPPTVAAEWECSPNWLANAE